MTDEFTGRLADTAARLLDKVRASIDWDKPGDAADYASALKDVQIARREHDED
jgi:hypothetical protein